MSIQDLGNKIKGFNRIDKNTLIISAIILLVALGSFFLGRISVQGNRNTEDVNIVDSSTGLPINKENYIEKSYENKKTISSTENYTNESSKGVYVASKNGKLYYTAECNGARRLSEKNKIWFDTSTEAENAGYTFAESCNK
jgi:hypothetical protein